MTYKHLRSANFPNVHVRLDGSGVTAPVGPGGGIANCQYGAGPWETFTQISNADGSVSFESMAFPNVFLRMDGSNVTHPTDPGAGTVNGQYTAGPWEKFITVSNSDGTYSLQSQQFSNVFLRIDGRGVTQPSGPGAGVVNCQFGIGPYEKLVVCDAPTSDMINGAIDKFVAWFPSQASQINANRAAIMARCCPPFAAYTVPNVAKTPLGFAPQVKQASILNPCQSALVSVVADVATLALSIVGLAVNVGEVRQALYHGLPGAELNALQRYFEALRIGYNAGGRVAARAIVDFLNGMFSVTSFGSVIWNYIYNEMSWWDWIVSGVTAVAQLIAWIGTEGVAAVAEVVLVITSIVQLPGDISTAYNACGSSRTA